MAAKSGSSTIEKLIKYSRLAYEEAAAEYATSGGDQEAVASKFSAAVGPVGRFIKAVVPNFHQKLDEVIFAFDNEMTVNPHQHGADLYDKDGSSVELKVSKSTTRAPTVHFNWPMPAGKTVEERRSNLISSIVEKTEKNGYAIFIVQNGIGVEIVRYTLCQAFLVAYFTRASLGKSNNYCISSDRCRTCKGFHRIEKYQAASDLYAAGKEADIDWPFILRATKSQCPLKEL